MFETYQIKDESSEGETSVVVWRNTLFRIPNNPIFKVNLIQINYNVPSEIYGHRHKISMGLCYGPTITTASQSVMNIVIL